MTISKVIAVVAIAPLLLTACHHPRYAHRHYHPPDPVTIVYHQPPPLKVVVRPAAPSVHHVWIAGHWAWRTRWVWLDGYYVKRPYKHAHWVAGHWKRKRRGWVWVPGHWIRG